MNSIKRKAIKTSIITVVALGLAFSTAWAVHFPGSNSSPSKVSLVASNSGMSSGRVPSADILPDGYGWVLTTAGLEITTNGGTSFTIATSPIPARNIHDVAVSGKNIHIVSVVNSTPAIEFSNDLGRTWKEMSLPAGSKNAGLAQFITHRGIIVGMLVTDITASNFSSGEWYSTPNGGVSWANHKIPAAGFVTATDGNLWLAAGPQFTSLYRSSDQGTTWKKVLTPNVSLANQGTWSIPGQLTNGDIVLVSTEMNAGAASKFGVTSYLSSDLGATWKVLARTSFAGQINSGETVTGAVYGNSIWLGSPTDEEVVIISSDGRIAYTSSTNRIFPNGAINSIIPTGSSSAWVTATNDQCTTGKTSCTEVGALLKTADSGKSWSKLNLEPSTTS